MTQTNAAQMVQQESGVLEAIPLLKEIGTLVESIWGRESIAYAQIDYGLAQAYAQQADFAASLPFMKSALSAFEKLLPADSKETADARTYVQLVEEQLSKEGVERTARQERLKKKFPKLMANGSAPAAAASSASSKEPVASTSAKVEPTPHGQKANLSVDELVNFIQGTPASKGKAPRKRKNSP